MATKPAREDEDRSNHSLLCALPPELLLIVLSSPSISARDLVAVELACSRFGRLRCEEDRHLSLTEQAAKTKLIHHFGHLRQHKRKRSSSHHALQADSVALKGSSPPSSLFRLLNETEEQESPTWSAPLGGVINMKYLVHHLLEEPPLPVFECSRCHWHVAGFRCHGRRPPRLVHEWVRVEEQPHQCNNSEEDEPPVPVPTGCGCFMTWNPRTKLLSCPLGCGSVGAPSCSCLQYPQRREEADAHPPLSQEMTYTQGSDPSIDDALAVLRMRIGQPRSRSIELAAGNDHLTTSSPILITRKTPSMSCIQCGYTVADYACLGKPGLRTHPPSAPPRPILQSTRHQRYWACYRFSCAESGCSIVCGGPDKPLDGALGDDWYDHRKGIGARRAFLCCKSKLECIINGQLEGNDDGTQMATLEWLDARGPPSNLESYRLVKRNRTTQGECHQHLTQQCEA